MTDAAIIQFQKKEEAAFLCSACGADRGCNCNAPAVEKLARKKEQVRQASKSYRERKAEGNQHPRHMTDDATTSAEERKLEYHDPQPPTSRQKHMTFCAWCDRVIRDSFYDGPVDQEVLDMISGVIEKLSNLKNALEEKSLD